MRRSRRASRVAAYVTSYDTIISSAHNAIMNVYAYNAACDDTQQQQQQLAGRRRLLMLWVHYVYVYHQSPDWTSPPAQCDLWSLRQ